ncbi:uncharacterized protein LOC112088836 [Eutrema salsugineum]|uniref:uncharacterized protein LOC112088836 n=1 Tax=Eutrema salsugineum TaxID=72664 RepID=UPI000CED3448|nr:uncharacterized protein LOC112088836 [Eutrema salsugineum]
MARTVAEICAMKSQVHNAKSAVPEIDRKLEETQRTPFTTRITEARIPKPGKVRISFYEGTTNPKAYITAFRIAMGQAFTKNAVNLTEQEKDAGYCLIFVEHLKGAELKWFQGRSATRSAASNNSPFCSSSSIRCLWIEELPTLTYGHYPKDQTSRFRTTWNKRQGCTRGLEAILVDALHRSSDFVVNKEEMKNLDEQYEATKTAIRSSILMRSSKKGNPSNNTTTQSSEEPRSGGAHNYQVGTGRGRREPRSNTWVRRPTKYDEKAFCKYHETYGHSTAQCQTL